ncbi:MAG: hypothetical protein SFY32_03660 [Bacteroidota bacterium]|nr:hypothetical protein [Bacteroidota bacterium]
MKRRVVFSKVFLLLLIICSIVFSNVNSQAQVLQKTVNIDVKNTRIDKVLDVISEQCNFNFTYNTSLFKVDSLVSFSAKGMNAKQALDKLFKNKFEYKVKGNNVVIVKTANKVVAHKRSNSNYIIKGAILNQKTGEFIAFASVYDTASLASAVSNDKGFFQLRIDAKSNQTAIGIAIAKKEYLDTIVQIYPQPEQNLTFELAPEPTPVTVQLTKDSSFNVQSTNDSTEQQTGHPKRDLVNEKWIQLFTSFKQRMNAINIPQIKNHDIQVSFIPALGTDGINSSSYNYKGSINVVGGYTGGVKGIELASVFNINKKDVKGAQLSGFLNATGGEVNGFQSAGFANVAYSKVHGVQSAGFMNINRDTLNGAQLAGFANISLANAKGAQIAGFTNIQKNDFSGGQIAGFMNVGSGKKTDLQIAGFCNVAYNNVAQIAGFANISNQSKVQLSGFVNVSKSITGAQMSGFINVTKYIKGFQLGVVNIVDSCDGVSLGLISLVKKGIHQIEISANEVTYANIAYRSGVKKLYIIYTAGYQPIINDQKFTYGLGLGHQIVLNSKSNINLELITHQVHLGSWEQFNNIYGMRVAYERYLLPKLSVFAGVTANVNLFDSKYDPLTPYSSRAYGGNKFYSQSYGNGYQLQSWIGFNAGIRFL